MKTLSLTLCALVLAASAAMAQTDHSTMDHSNMDHSTMTMSDDAMQEAVHTNAIVNAIGDGTVNVSHDPIPEIGWPAMTMDMPLIAGAQIDGVAAGDTVVLMLIKGDDGMYAIAAMMPE